MNASGVPAFCSAPRLAKNYIACITQRTNHQAGKEEQTLWPLWQRLRVHKCRQAEWLAVRS